MASAGLQVPMGLCVIVMVPCADATPVVIHDAGNTKSIAPYYESLSLSSAGKRLRQPYGRARDNRPSVVRLPFRRAIEARDVVPIHTPEMRPGYLEPRQVTTHLPRPLFLVGADAESLHWLAEHRTQLLEMGATGMLVEAATVDELRAVADVAQGLPIVPAPASDIARALGIEVYPVLITNDGVEQ